MKKVTANTIFWIIVFIGITVASVNISKQATLTRLINEKNAFCQKLGQEMTNQSNIECYCYFEGFRTGNQELDQKTNPLCVCECMVNGTIKKVAILQTKN